MLTSIDRTELDGESRGFRFWVWVWVGVRIGVRIGVGIRVWIWVWIWIWVWVWARVCRIRITGRRGVSRVRLYRRKTAAKNEQRDE